MKSKNIWRWFLQFFIFFIMLIISTWIINNSLIWILFLALSFFWYCFTSKDDKNLFFDKEAIIKRLKTSKARWIWFIALTIIFWYSSLWSYQWEYQEQVQNTVENINSNLENFNEWIDDTLSNATIEVAKELKELEDKSKEMNNIEE